MQLISFHLNHLGDLSFYLYSLNCQSIRAKIDYIKILMHKIRNLHCHFDVICLQDTWLTEHCDTSLIEHCKGRMCSARGGLLIYIHNRHKYKIIDLHNNSEIWDGQFVEISTSSLPKKL